MPAVALRALRCLRGQHLAVTRTANVALRSQPRALLSPWRGAPAAAALDGPLSLRRRGFAEQAQKEGAEGAKAEDSKAAEQADGAAQEQAGGSASSSAGEKQAGDFAPVGEAEASAEEKESPQEILEKELAEAEAKLKKEKHELLLQLADFENNKKKNLKEREGRRRNAMVNVARRMVEVYAEFDQFAHMEDNIEGMSDSGKSLQEGINLTRDLYRSTLEKFDVLPLSPEAGQPLVTARHEEVGAVEAEGVAAGAVAEVVKPGWIFEPQSPVPVVIQKAQVKVARSGPATPPPPP